MYTIVEYIVWATTADIQNEGEASLSILDTKYTSNHHHSMIGFFRV